MQPSESERMRRIDEALFLRVLFQMKQTQETQAETQVLIAQALSD